MDSLFGIPMDTLMVICLVAFGVVISLVAVSALRERTFFKLAFRNIPRRPGRTVLIVLGLMLGTLIVSAAFSTGDTMSHTIRSSVLTSLGNVDEIISVRGTDIGADSFIEAGDDIAYFDEELFVPVSDELADFELVDGVAPVIIETVAVQDRSSRQNEPRVTIFAADPAHMAGFGEIKEVGGGPVSLADLGPGEVYLNDEAADELNGSAGDELLVFAAGRPETVRAKAIVEYQGVGTDGSAVLMPLDGAQRLLDKEGLIKHITVSNRGGALSGAEHTAEVIARLEPVVAPQGLEVDPTKGDALDFVNELGSVFTSFFVTFGMFSIAAGIMLIALIFVMLAAERRSEMGMARAVGTKRRHLIQMFLYEGTAYSLIASAVGALLGLAIAYGMVFIMAQAFATFGVEIKHDFRPRSLIVAYTLGMLLSFIVVTVSAWRVSVLNIVTAIRDLPDPPLQKGGLLALVAGVLAFLVGILLTIAGLSSEQATPFYLGISFTVIGVGPFLKRLRVPDRVAYTLTGIVLLVWWLLPFDTFSFVLPEFSSDISIFIVSGIMIVIGGVWVVMYNSDLLLHGIVAVFGRIRWLTPVLKTAVSYPLTKRFRTGMTLAMFSLVVFTLVVMATLTSAFSDLFNNAEAFGGGFDIRATTAHINPISDIDAAIQQSPDLSPEDFEVVAGQSIRSLESRQTDVRDRDSESYPVLGADDDFLANNIYEFALIAEGFDSPRQVWQALADNPNLAIVDPLPIPTRANFGFEAGGPGLELEGFFLEDETFSPVEVDVMDPETGEVATLTIIGVLKDTFPPFMLGITTSERTLAAVFADQEPPSIHFFGLREGVSADTTAVALESTFLANGMEADVLEEELEEQVGTQLTFNYILQGFMGLGLLVGVAALGVISARSVVERRQQIGVLRAIGFQRWMVQLSFLLESSFVTVLGIVVGSILGLILSYNIINDNSDQGSSEGIRFAVPWLNLIIIFLIAYGASLLTTFLPSRQASRLHPSEALRYE